MDAAGNKDEGAGDQGMMFGYACRETDALMPAPIYYAHAILHRIRELRHVHDKSVDGLLPDAKSQVTLRYIDGKPVGADQQSWSPPSMSRTSSRPRSSACSGRS